MKLPTTAVFDHPTSTALARHLANAFDTADTSRPGRQVATPTPQGFWPVTGYQRDILAVSARYPDLPIAQVVAHARLDGTVDLERMRECVRRAYFRNDALRLRFELRDGEFVQHVGSDLPEVEFVDFTGDSDPATACRRWIDVERERMLPPDGPPTRAAVLVDSRDSFLMYTCFHHAVADARGINLALSQVLTDYESLVGTGHDSGNEPPQYADFASAEREYRSSPAWTTDRDYFVENYRDVQPALFTRSGSVHSRRRHHHTLRVTPESARRVRDTGRSIFAFTAAAIGEYLRRIHRGKDIILGVPFLNRISEADLRTVGCMTNMLPLRIPVDDALSVAELADQNHRTSMGTTGATAVRIRRHRHSAEGGTGGASPMFDVTYSYLTIPDAEEAARHWKDSGVLASGYSLDAVNIIVRDHERDGSLDVDLFYADDVFDANYRIEDTLRHVLTLIERALDEPALAVGDIEMLTTEDHTQLDAFAYGVPFDV